MSSRHDRGFVEVPEVNSDETPKSSSHKAFAHHGPNSFVLILCVVILILLGAVGYLLKRPNLYGNSSSNSLAFPADITNPAVASVELVYEYRGIVTAVKDENYKVTLTTDIKGEALPEFVIDSSTKTYLFSKGKEVSMAPNVIKVGDKVVLFENYDLTTKTWKLAKVDLISDTVVIPPAQITPPPLSKTKPKTSPSPTPTTKR